MTRPIAQYRGPRDERKGDGLERANTRLDRALKELDAARKGEGTQEARERAAMEAFRKRRKVKPQESDLEWRDRTWMP